MMDSIRAKTADVTKHISVTADQLRSRLDDSGEVKETFLLDIRRKEDFDDKHIDGAVNFDLDNWNDPGALETYPKDKQIVVICYTGATARQVTEDLKMMDFDAVVLDKGIYGYYPDLAEALLEDMEAAIGDLDGGLALSGSSPFT